MAGPTPSPLADDLVTVALVTVNRTCIVNRIATASDNSGFPPKKILNNFFIKLSKGCLPVE